MCIKIHEFQSKDLLAKYGVPVPRGDVASNADEVWSICRDLGGKAVIKAQVYAGGRGKAGGVRLVSSPQEGYEYASSIIGRRLVTVQTSPDGAPVQKLLVEESIQVVQELYLALTVGRSFQGPVFIASSAGGMEIEEVALNEPERIFNQAVDIAVGLQPFQGRRLALSLGLDSHLVGLTSQLMSAIYKLFMENDCSLIEINPLVVTADGSMVALDAKVDLDDDALFRHSDLAQLTDPDQEDHLEVEASQSNIAYVKLGGTVGCLVNGAGLAMATMDLVKGVGASPANFLDVGGGADEMKVAKAVDIMLTDSDVKLVLVNIFGGILRCDVVARGIVEACEKKACQIPFVVRMQGTNVDEGKKILASSQLNVTFALSLSEVATKLKVTLD